MSKVIWKLSEEEKNEILNLYEKKVALENLTKTIEPESEKLYNKLIFDYGKTITEFQNWWKETSKKYNWEGESWRIDFQTNEVILQET